ncbi:MAG: ABC transporter permease, partial [Acidobacteriaceae bacterium]
MATATAPTPASIGLTRPKTSLSSSLWIPAYSLWRRELVRFYRQKARVVGVIASPLLFWLVLGSGFSKTFQSHGAASTAASGSTHYLSYFFPGAIIMIVLFTAIFSMMSLIQDRNEGFLLSVLASPVS